MEKEIRLTVTEEQTNYLQRLGVDIDNRVFIIDRLFANHAEDTDGSFLENKLFKEYMNELETVKAEYEFAKQAFGEKILRPQVEKLSGEGVEFDWAIKDFSVGEAEIYIK